MYGPLDEMGFVNGNVWALACGVCGHSDDMGWAFPLLISGSNCPRNNNGPNYLGRSHAGDLKDEGPTHT